MKISRQLLAPKLLDEAVNAALPLLGIAPESPEAERVMRSILELVRETRAPVWNIIPGATADRVTIARGAHFNNGVQITTSGGRPQVLPIGRTRRAMMRAITIEADGYNGIPLAEQKIPHDLPPYRYNW